MLEKQEREKERVLWCFGLFWNDGRITVLEIFHRIWKNSGLEPSKTRISMLFRGILRCLVVI
jgi:hypothetical protein